MIGGCSLLVCGIRYRRGVCWVLCTWGSHRGGVLGGSRLDGRLGVNLPPFALGGGRHSWRVSDCPCDNLADVSYA